MTKIFKNRDAFLEAHKNDQEYYGSLNDDGTYTDHENFSGYKSAHPEDFRPVENGKIQGAKSIGFVQPRRGRKIANGVKSSFNFAKKIFIALVVFMLAGMTGNDIVLYIVGIGILALMIL